MGKEKYSPTFAEYLSQKVTKVVFDTLPELMNCSRHRITKIFNDPKCANNRQLIKFAELCNVQPYELIDSFSFALDFLSEIEVEFYKRSFDYSQRPIKKAV